MALLAKLRPCGAWRVGPDSGDRLRVDRILHSDTLYSALTLAFMELGLSEEWLSATASSDGGASAVRIASCFPFVDDVLFVAPPDTMWPPQESLRIRWQSARYIPTTAVAQLLSGKALVEEHWVVDGVSECLLPVIRNVPVSSPFRLALRSRAAVDRMGAGVEPFQIACLEFSRGAGIWTAFTFASAEVEALWAPRVEGALRLLADSGLGGERSSGWGRFEQPEFARGEIGPLLFGGRYRAPEEVSGYWLLSLFSPGAGDSVDWQQGSYRVVTRTGRVDRSGDKKRANQMVAEGSVLVAAGELQGTARNVAPEGYAHPVYRAGFALALPIGKPKPPQAQAAAPAKPKAQQQQPAAAAVVTPPALVAEPEPAPAVAVVATEPEVETAAVVETAVARIVDAPAEEATVTREEEKAEAPKVETEPVEAPADAPPATADVAAETKAEAAPEAAPAENEGAGE